MSAVSESGWLVLLLFGVLSWGGTGPASAGRVLVALPFTAYSHVVPFLPIYKELADRGHEVHLLSNFTLDPPPKTFKQIKFDYDIVSFIIEVSAAMDGQLDAMSFNGPVYYTSGMWTACPFFSQILLKNIKPLLPPRSSHYDLVIIEPFFCQEFMIGLSHYYGAPLVAVLPGPMTPHIADILRNPSFLFNVPNLRLPFTDNMNFLQRVWNHAVNLIELTGYYLYHLPRQDAFMRELLEDDKDLPYISEVQKNISLILIETHPAVTYPRPYLKNVVEVGAASIKPKNKLPKEYEDFLNESEHGVILFSWGSHFVEQNPEPYVKALMETFSKLKERVIFKWSNLTIPNKPKNVLVSQWVPQLALLAHKKTKLFISHCGLNSFFETAYFGVPVVGTPLFGDQHYNSRILESIGMGLTVHKQSILDGSSLLSAVNRVITEPRKNAEIRREMMRDRPTDAVKEGAYWIEYVMKYSGAKHLRPPESSWLVESMLDVWLSLLALPLVPLIGIMIYLKRFKKTGSPVVKDKVSMSKKVN